MKKLVSRLTPDSLKNIRRHLAWSRLGRRFAERFPDKTAGIVPGADNPLERYFDQHREGPGIFKWRHYFEIYHRHLAKFVGKPVNVVEIGVYSGGSLGMWRSYFGPQATIYGVDIVPECRAYEGPGIRIFIGDQADPAFWADFLRQVPAIDVVIDDGGHEVSQQTASLEALLPHLSPGGVYICEDVGGRHNGFASFVHGVTDLLHERAALQHSADLERRDFTPTNPLQRAVGSIHIYPFLYAIERTADPPAEFVSSKHGTEWQPFL